MYECIYIVCVDEAWAMSRESHRQWHTMLLRRVLPMSWLLSVNSVYTHECIYCVCG